MSRPFFILGLPRSRTYWLSRFLTYRDWTCGHEELRHLRSFEDVKSWLSQPCVGSAETALAPFWRLIPEDAQIVIIRRPVAEVKDSLLRLNAGMNGAFDPIALDGLLKRLDAKLDQIRARRRGVLFVKFEDLQREDVCRDIFEHCLPYPFDREWWRTISQFNLQANVPAVMAYHIAFAPQIAKMALAAKQTILRNLATKHRVEVADMEFSEEPFDKFYLDGKPLFAEHANDIGLATDVAERKNISLYRVLDASGMLQIVTARSNGRMFGYLMMEIAPSKECEGRLSAVQTLFYASKDAPRLGIALEREAIARLRTRGISDVFGCSGIGEATKLSLLYRRFGFASAGELHRLSLEN